MGSQQPCFSMKTPRVSAIRSLLALTLSLGGAVDLFRLHASTRGSNGTATAVLTGSFDTPNVPQNPPVITDLNVLRTDKGGLNGFRAVSADPVASGLGQMRFQNWSHWTPEPLSSTDLYFGIFGPFSLSFSDKGGFTTGADMLVFQYDWSYNYHVDLNGVPAHPINLNLPIQGTLPAGYTFDASIEAIFSDITTDGGDGANNVVLHDAIPTQISPLGGGGLGVAESLTASDIFGPIDTTIFNDTGINVSGTLLLRVGKLAGAEGGEGIFFNIPVEPIPDVPWMAPPAVVPEPRVHAMVAAAVLGLWALVRRLRRDRGG